MTIHKVGYGFILLILVLLLILEYFVWLATGGFPLIFFPFTFTAFVFFLIVVSFFRKPKREIHKNDNFIYAPADGTVVVIEETMETEYFNEMRIQISIFMSPLNVHINWFPVAGIVKYFRHHPGKHMYAWLPKASTDNERSTIVIKKNNGTEILVRQIAGALARRIVSFTKENAIAKQNRELGFIKFGSRVDVFLPIGTKINVQLEQKVKGTQTVIAEFD